jgi:hypothetical protein
MEMNIFMENEAAIMRVITVSASCQVFMTNFKACHFAFSTSNFCFDPVLHRYRSIPEYSGTAC